MFLQICLRIYRYLWDIASRRIYPLYNINEAWSAYQLLRYDSEFILTNGRNDFKDSRRDFSGKYFCLLALVERYYCIVDDTYVFICHVTSAIISSSFCVFFHFTVLYREGDESPESEQIDRKTHNFLITSAQERSSPRSGIFLQEILCTRTAPR